jgi:hypothetical protein
VFFTAVAKFLLEACVMLRKMVEVENLYRQVWQTNWLIRGREPFEPNCAHCLELLKACAKERIRACIFIDCTSGAGDQTRERCSRARLDLPSVSWRPPSYHQHFHKRHSCIKIFREGRISSSMGEARHLGAHEGMQAWNAITCMTRIGGIDSEPSRPL